MLVGSSIILVPISVDDTADIIRWRNSETVKNNFIFRDTLTEDTHISWLNNYVSEGKAVQFIIKEKESNFSIGTVYLRDIDPINLKAEYGIYIGEESVRGKGYGTQAAELIIQYAFNTLELHKVFLRVLKENVSAIRSYEKAGFTTEGCFKDEVKIAGEYYDIVFMAIINKNERHTDA